MSEQTEHLLNTAGLWHLKPLRNPQLLFALDPDKLRKNDAFTLFMRVLPSQLTEQLEKDLVALVLVQNKSKHMGSARNALIAELRRRRADAERCGRSDP